LPDVPHLDKHGGNIFKPGESVTVTCESGYKVNTPSTICQSDRTWNPIPVCTKVTCYVPTFIGGYTGCRMTNNATRRVCNASNTWSGTEPVCDIVKCNKPLVINGSLSTQDTVYTYNSSVTIKCIEGFEMKDGQYTQTCQVDGTWGTHVLVCVKTRCNDNSEIKQAFILSYPEELAVGETGNVFYNSTYFYLQQGSVEVNCSSNRKLAWTKSSIFGKIVT